MIGTGCALVNRGTSRYPPRMEPLTVEALRTLAQAQGLNVSDEDLAGLLPLVTGGRELVAALDQALYPEVEPASEYRLRAP
jgi:hypothetical protein